MANTVITLKKSSTPSAVPDNLANGELAINFADGKLFYKSVNGTITAFSSASTGNNSGDNFGIINANGTLILAGTTTDTFAIVPSDFITITGDAIKNKIVIGANLKVLYDVANAAFDKANSSTSPTSSGNSFTSIVVPGQNTVSASANDTLNLSAGDNINITTNSFTKTITISSQNIGANVDYGWINLAFLTTTQNYGSI